MWLNVILVSKILEGIPGLAVAAMMFVRKRVTCRIQPASLPQLQTIL